jgi:hypothetical protein
MAAMSTALTEFSDKENSRTFFYTGHTVTKPKLVLQRRSASWERGRRRRRRYSP